MIFENSYQVGYSLRLLVSFAGRGAGPYGPAGIDTCYHIGNDNCNTKADDIKKPFVADTGRLYNSKAISSKRKPPT